jgi:glucose dehydrogenase
MLRIEGNDRRLAADEINKDNTGDLKGAWTYVLGGSAETDSDQTFASTYRSRYRFR